MRFDAGEFNQRIEIQAPPSARNDLNELTGDWTTIKRVWARVRPATAKEFTNADRPFDESTYKFTIRWNAITKGVHRVLWMGEFYIIDGEPLVLGGGAHRYLQITGVLRRD